MDGFSRIPCVSVSSVKSVFYHNVRKTDSPRFERGSAGSKPARISWLPHESIVAAGLIAWQGIKCFLTAREVSFPGGRHVRMSGGGRGVDIGAWMRYIVMDTSSNNFVI